MKFSGHSLATLRSGLGLSQEGLADACMREGCEVFPDDVRAWERGTTVPCPRCVRALLAALSVACHEAGFPPPTQSDLSC